MPPLVCIPPAILDQSFPRDKEELRSIAIAIGNIQSQLDDDRIRLLLTGGLVKYLEMFDWNVRDGYELILQIHYHIGQWYLSGNARTAMVDVSQVGRYYAHPVPKGHNRAGLLELWSNEVGKLLAKHTQRCRPDGFCVGIACDSAYSGSCKGEYDNPGGLRTFPLVGPGDIAGLDDAYCWEVPRDIGHKRVSPRHVKTNYSAIGATEVKRPSRDSHYKLVFPGKRSWPFTDKVDPIPPRYLDELVPITKLPSDVIKYALIEGRLPDLRLRLV